VVIVVVASAWFALADSAIELVLARGLAGLGIGTFQPAARAVVAASAPDKVGTRLGRLSATETAGFVSGPVLAAGAFELWGLDAPFWLLAAMLVACLPALFRARLPIPARESEPRPRTEIVRAIFGRRDAVAAILLGAALFLPAGMYEAIWARFMADLGASTLFVGFTLSMYGIPFALTAALGGGFIDARGPRRAAVIAIAIVAPLTMVYGSLRSPWLLMSLAMVEAVGNGLGLPASQAAMSRSTRAGEHTAGQGLVAAAGQIGAGFASLLAAPLYVGLGPEVMFFMVGSIVVLVGGAGLWIGRPLPRVPEPA
jgi:MFS family permease